MHTVRFVHTGNECDTVEADDGQTVLRVADENGIETRRGCESGHCSICRMHVREGLGNLLNKRTKEPFTKTRVETCVAEIHGDVTLEAQKPKPKPIIEATLPSNEQSRTEKRCTR